MARDVEFALTASDKTGAALASVERGFKRTYDRIAKQQDDIGGSRLIQAVAKSSPIMAARLTSVFGQVAEAGPALLTAGVAAAAPLIGATLSAAIIGGAGVGGVVGGVLLASKDPRVQAAGTKMGENLLAGLKTDAEPFVEPLLTAIGRIQAKADELQPRFQHIFANSSKYLGPLVTALLHGVDSITAGFDKLIGKAGPVMTELGQDITQITDHTGNFLETISGGSEGAAAALHTLTNGVTLLEDTLGPTILGLTKLYGWLDKIGAATGILGAFADATQKTGDETTFAAAAGQTAAAALAQIGTQAAEAAGPVATFTDQVNNLANAGRNAFDTETNLAASVDQLKKSLEDNGKTLDEHTAKGRANRSALSAVAQQYLATYNNAVELNGEGIKSNAVAASNREAFIKLAGQFTKTKGEAAALATQFGLIPAKKNSTFTANTHDAAARIDALKEKVDSVHGKTVNVTVAINTGRLASIENRLSRLGGSLYNAAGVNWAAVDTNSGTARTGGPTPVNVNNNVAVSLDGAPFYAMTARTVRDRADRDAWRQKVGSR